MNADFLASAANVGPLGTLPLTEGLHEDAEILGGDYLLLEQVGAGGAGEVHRAIQLSTRREVAVKRLRPGRSDERFSQEVSALSRLKHPGIVGLIQAGVHETRPFLVMEWVRGQSLAERLSAGPLPPREAVRVVRDAASAIGHAHRMGIIHRDVKPGNLLLGLDGTVRVTDFSIAKVLAAEEGMTVDGQTLGTPAYMAPEQFEARRGTVWPATDVHGLGATLYHALTGRAPFASSSRSESTGMVATREPEWGGLWSGIHPDLRTLCQRAMHPDPARRFGSAEDFAADLVRFLEGQPIHARPVTPLERWARWVWRPWPMATLAALVLGLATAGWATGTLHRTRVKALLKDWPKPSPEPIRVLGLVSGSTGGLRASFTADGRLFAWGASDGHVRLASVEPPAIVANSLKRTEPVRYHRFLPGSGRTNLFVAADDGLWRVWTAGSRRRILAEGRAKGGVAGFDASANGLLFGVASAAGELSGYSLAAGMGALIFKGQTEGTPIGLHLTTEPERILSVSHWGVFQCWDPGTDSVLWRRQIPDVPTTTAMTRDRDILAVGTADVSKPNSLRGWLRFYRTADGTEISAVPLGGRLQALVYSPDGTRLMVLREQNQVRLCDAEGQHLRDVGSHAARIVGAEFSPDGLRILTWDMTGQARLWDAHTAQPLTGFWSGVGGIAHATFAPDGGRIGSGDIPPTGTLWDDGCPLPKGWDRAALSAALVRDGSLEALRRAAWLNPKDGTILRRLAEATRQESTDSWRDAEARFLERRAEEITAAAGR